MIGFRGPIPFVWFAGIFTGPPPPTVGFKSAFGGWVGGGGVPGGETPPEPPVIPPIIVVPSGVKRRYRVRRSDFSTQENYEIALRMALQGAHFTVLEHEEEPPKPPAEISSDLFQPKDKGRIAEMLVRAIEDDYPIGTQEQILALQKPMTEMELLALFLTIVE